MDFLTTKIKSRLADRESVLNRYSDSPFLTVCEMDATIQTTLVLYVMFVYFAFTGTKMP